MVRKRVPVCGYTNIDVLIQVHRRTLKDDSRGVAEPLNETGQYGEGLIIRSKHYVLVESIKESAQAHRMMAEQILLSPHLSFDVSTANVSLVPKQYNTMVSEERVKCYMQYTKG